MVTTNCPVCRNSINNCKCENSPKETLPNMDTRLCSQCLSWRIVCQCQKIDQTAQTNSNFK